MEPFSSFLVLNQTVVKINVDSILRLSSTMIGNIKMKNLEEIF